MAQEDDLRGLAKTIQFMKAVSILLLVVNVYYFCHSAFVKLGLAFSLFDTILIHFQNGTTLFSSPWVTQGGALLLLGISLLGEKGVKSEKITWSHIGTALLIGTILFLGSNIFLHTNMPSVPRMLSYATFLGVGYLLIFLGGIWIARLLKNNMMNDVFNTENESFMQETRFMNTEYSVNLPTKFKYQSKWHKGWINVINPFRATMVLGTPGSGKSFAVVNNFIKQHIEKGFAMYVYDFKFPDLSKIVYNHFVNHQDAYTITTKEGKKKNTAQFCVINFDDPRKTQRCNPINPKFLVEIADAYESAYTIMMNLNKTWIQKQGDFFVESPIVLLAAMIWFLKRHKDSEQDEEGKYCTFPHVIELLMQPYTKTFPILMSYPELANYLSPFMDAWQGGAQEQLQGQIASAKIPLTRMVSPILYWVMTGDDFTLDINNPEAPKLLVVGNNPDRQNIYSTALSLYNSRIVAMVNKPNKRKCSMIIDELPTMFFRGLDNLIATGRGRKVAVTVGFQDFTQLIRDYGDKEAKAILGTIANVFSGQVVAETARSLSERYGKILQKRTSQNISRNDKSMTISTQMDSLIPASKISALSQGWFVGNVQDDFGMEIEQKTFHCQIVVDLKKIKEEEKNWTEIPLIIPRPEDVENTPEYIQRKQEYSLELHQKYETDQEEKTFETLPEGYQLEVENKLLREFKAVSDEDLNMAVEENYYKIKQEITDLVDFLYENKKNDPQYAHLFQNSQ